MTLGKERGLNLEGTARWENETMSVGVNLFVTDFADFIYLTPTGAELDDLPVFAFSQQDAQFTAVSLCGISIAGRPAQGRLEIRCRLDFVSAEFDDGSDVPYIPPVTLNAGAEADWGALALGAKLTWAAIRTHRAQACWKPTATSRPTCMPILTLRAMASVGRGRNCP